jgi:phospholipase C
MPDRRRPRILVPFLALALVVVVAAVLAPARAERARAATDTQGIFNLDHLIFIVQENRSFDHYFGTFPGVDGFPMVRGRPSACVPDPVLHHASCVYHSRQLRQNGGPHDRKASIADINGGAMNGFVEALDAHRHWCVDRTADACRPYVGPDLQPDVLSYHDDREIPNYWTYARQFVLQDHMFAPTDSWTLPSHLFLVSGWSAVCSDPNDPMSCVSNVDLRKPGQYHRYGDPPLYAWTDITYLLHEGGVSWAYYVAVGTCSFERHCHVPNGPWGNTPAGKNPLPGFTDLYETSQQANIRSHAEFLTAAANGTLPSVSWVVPGNNVSEHPRSNGTIADG